MPILNLASWPSAEELELDDSQLAALQLALTKEFAVIQGPPGTGKTYIGLKVRCGLGGRGEGWGLVDGADQGVRCDSRPSRDGENVHWAEGKM